MSGATSDTHSPAADASDASGQQQQPPAKKRRTTAGGAASSRGVANLTPEQLARKRANDREAQRAIRERTRNQLDTLHARIRELEGQQPYQDLRAVAREKDAVVAENVDIKKRLEQVLAIIQPIVRAGCGLNELAAAAERSPLPLSSHHPTDPRTFNSTLREMATATSNGITSPHGPDTTLPWGFPGDAPTSHVRQWSADSSHDRVPPISTETSFDDRMGVDFLCETSTPHRPVDPALVAQSHPPTVNGTAHHAPLLNPFATLPRNIAPTCPLDALCLDFFSEMRTRAAAGVPSTEIAGPAYPSFTTLVHPNRKCNHHPLSKLNTDIIRTFPDICGLPEQVAIIYIMFLVMRWLVDPTRENYERLPDWVQPRPSQLFIPHPFWMDYIPWPRMRDTFIATRKTPDFNTFFIPYTMTISLNWPHSQHDVLIPASRVGPHSTTSIPGSSPFSNTTGGSPATNHSSKENEEWIMNPAFEAHLRDLKNWSLGPAFATTFPESVAGVWIKEDAQKGVQQPPSSQ
ncbi:hypothetical protein CC80DRAFT_483743 [Byssothecium circinans]|uniref:BZIP transcription factor n=1 Tax=Byssothecium circinans TaxID=147558 RepID=A0A6A5TC61_9PLEO|nr:hypothetical protein CC80DRAFT_483743 [Byssothecium circinans]